MFRAYAKINLGLFVLRKRRDGYHDIETIFHRIDLFDEITLQPSPGISVECSAGEVPGDERNICHKAARMLQSFFGIDTGVCITIVKNIPVGAGLGGGSADGALVLKELPQLWGKRIDDQTLRTLALELGSDVPFFLGRGSASARGRGEILEYFELDIPYTILLCNPHLHVSTAWAYARIRPKARADAHDLQTLVREGMLNPPLLRNALRNDFEPPVFETYPEVLLIKETMVGGGAEAASMSGSGSSVYGFFSRPEAAQSTSRMLQSKGYKTFLTRPHFQP